MAPARAPWRIATSRVAYPLINPDNIAREQPGIGAVRAGRLAIERRRELLLRRESFAWETTLSGQGELTLLKQARDAGYKVNLAFIGVSDPALSLLRIDERIAAGGHSIAPQDVGRRFERSLANLPRAMELADRAFVFDNSGKRRRLMFTHELGQTRHVSKDMPRWLHSAFPIPSSARERLLRNLESVAEHPDERSQKRLSLEEIGQRELDKQQRELEKQRSLEAEHEPEHSGKQKDPDLGLDH